MRNTLDYIFRGRDYRQLLYKFLEPIDRAMLFLALFPCNGEKVTRSLQSCIWEWIAARKAENLEFIQSIATRGYARIFSMVVAHDDINLYKKAVMNAAVISGSEEMIRAAWKLGAYCPHGVECCVQTAIKHGHLELAERLAWGALTHVNIEEYISTGRLIPADYHAEVLRVRNAKHNGRFNLVCKRDKPAFKDLKFQLKVHPDGFKAEFRMRLIYGWYDVKSWAEQIPKLNRKDIIERLAASGNLEALKHIHKLNPDDFKGVSYYRRAACNGHLHVIQWINTVNGIDAYYAANCAIEFSRSNVVEWVLDLNRINLKRNEVKSLMLSAAKISYEIYITVERSWCYQHAGSTLSDSIAVLFQALISGNFKTINHVFGLIKCRMDEFKSSPDAASKRDSPERFLFAVNGNNAYVYANGNVDVIQWINDNLHPPEYDLISVSAAPKKLRVIAAKKLVSLGAKLSPTCLNAIIKLKDDNLMQYLNSCIVQKEYMM